MPWHMDNRTHHSRKGWGKAGCKLHQKICLSTAREAFVLEVMEDREMGDINGDTKGSL